MDFINLLWNSNQENRINGIEGHVIGSDYASKRAEVGVRSMKTQYDRMVLILAGLGELLLEKGILTEQELSQRITEIDERDGVRDGRRIQGILKCPKCGCGISRTFKKCLTCGYESSGISTIETL